MIARPVLVFLIVLNLGAALWWALHTARAPAPARADALPPLEIAKDVGNPAAVVPDNVAVTSQTTAAGLADARCVLLGAYGEARDVQRALTALRGIGLQADAVTRLNSPRGFNVLIPPLSSPEAAADVQAKLRAAGFQDQFLIRQGAQSNGIALGRFGTEAAARALLARLKAAGFQAQLSPVGASTTELWIRALHGSEQDETALRKLASAPQAKSIACDQ